MKSVIFPALALLLYIAATPVHDAFAERQKLNTADVTSSGQMAMIFYRLTGQVPDFEVWATKAESYENASPFDKVTVLQQKTAELRNIFNLISLQEPVIVRMKAKLSAYSQTNHGFFIENFKDDTFFSYTFMDANYALVPQALLDHQWISVTDAQAKTLEKIAYGSAQRKLDIYIEIIPKSADKAAPMNLEGGDHWLVMGEISNIRIYDPIYKGLVWENKTDDAPSATMQELLNLKQ